MFSPWGPGDPTLLPMVQGERTYPWAGREDLSLGLQKPKDGKMLTAVYASICIREQALIQHTLTSICRHQDLGEHLKLSKNFLALQN